ncbi:hypothetical protein JCM10135_06560 [Stetteria hydrogenophila]
MRPPGWFYSGVVARVLGFETPWRLPEPRPSYFNPAALGGGSSGWLESPFTANVRVSRDYQGTYEDEPTIAANPLDPSNLVAAAHQELGYGQGSLRVTVGVYYSLDGGDSWQGPILAEAYDPENDWLLGDPALDAGPDGAFYLAYLSVGYRPLPPPFNESRALQSTIMLGVSRDGGRTWEFRPAVTPDYINVTDLVKEGLIPDTLLLDKEYIAVGRSPFTGGVMIVISYTEFVEGYNYTAHEYVGRVTIKAVVSHDGGRTWIGPFPVSPTLTYGPWEEAPRIVQGSYPAIAHNGTIFIAYYDALDDGWLNGSAAVMVTRSDNGGKTWSRPVVAAVLPGELGYYYTIGAGVAEFPAFRWWSSMFPSIAVAPDGSVYIAYAADPDGPGCDPADIYLAVSRDWGRTWGRPVRVNTDPEGACNAQFLPWVEAGPDGSAHIAWADTRLAPGRAGFDIYYDRYVNGSFTGNVRVTDYTSPAFTAGFVGDYINLAVTPENVHVVWTDTRRSFYPVLDTPLFGLAISSTDIFTARLGSRPRPVVNATPEKLPAGRGAWVRLEASGLPREALFAVMVNNYTAEFAVTDSDGRAVVNLFVPALAEGEYEVAFVGAASYAAYATFKLRVVDYIARGLEVVEENVSSIQARLDSVEGALDSALQGLAEVKGRVEVLMESVENASAAIAGLAGGQEELRKQLAGLAGRLTVLEGNITTLGERVAEIREAQKALESRQSEAAAALGSLDSKVSKLDSKITKLEDTLSGVQSTLGDVIDGIEGVNSKLDEARALAYRAQALSAATLALVVAALALLALAARRRP